MTLPVVSSDFVDEIAAAIRVNMTEYSLLEITSLIQAGAADLNRQGVDILDLADPLTKQALKLYCKAHYGYDQNADRFLMAYEALSAGMSLSGDYDKGGDSGE